MDTTLLNEKVLYLKESLKKLQKRYETYQETTDPETQETLYAAMAKFAEEIVKTAIKINTKLLEEHDDVATSYYQSFIRLYEHYPALDHALLEKLARTTGLRNRIAHEYDSMDKSITLKSLAKILELYASYIEMLRTIIRKD
jgi:uncharacterized protein YutE (UPF0331/DUF86 family)